MRVNLKDIKHYIKNKKFRFEEEADQPFLLDDDLGYNYSYEDDNGDERYGYVYHYTEANINGAVYYIYSFCEDDAAGIYHGHLMFDETTDEFSEDNLWVMEKKNTIKNIPQEAI